MPRNRPPYPAEFRQRIIESVARAAPLSRWPSSSSRLPRPIRKWLAQADRNAGHRPDGLTTDEREALRRLLCQGDRLDPVQGFEFVTAHRATHPIATLCRVLGVSPSGYTGVTPVSPSWRGQRHADPARILAFAPRNPQGQPSAR